MAPKLFRKIVIINSSSSHRKQFVCTKRTKKDSKMHLRVVLRRCVILKHHVSLLF